MLRLAVAKWMSAEGYDVFSNNDEFRGLEDTKNLTYYFNPLVGRLRLIKSFKLIKRAIEKYQF